MKFLVQSSISFMIVFLLLIQLQKPTEANEYDDCSAPFQCGDVNITYPFYDGRNRPDHCGYPGFEFECDSEYQMPEISLADTSNKYYLLHMDANSQTISVAPEDYWNGYCPENLENTILNPSLFRYTPMVENVTLYYACPGPLQATAPNQFSCPNRSNDQPVGYFMTRSMQSVADHFSIPPGLCQSSITVPVNQSVAGRIVDMTSLWAAFRNGFDLNWIADNGSCPDCRRVGGECGYDKELGTFACYCPDDVVDPICHVKGTSHLPFFK